MNTVGFGTVSVGMAVMLLAGAILAFAIRLVRRPRVEPVVIFTATDVRVYVELRAANKHRLVRDALVDCILFDAGAPVLGVDWQPWLDENWQRLVVRAIDAVAAEEQLSGSRGVS